MEREAYEAAIQEMANYVDEREVAHLLAQHLPCTVLYAAAVLAEAREDDEDHMDEIRQAHRPF